MVSMRVTVMAVTLVALCVLATNTAYIFCCRRYIPQKIPFSEIKGFSVQKSTALCPIRAIIFHTKRGKRCVDPTLEWVMDYVGRIECLAQQTSVPNRRHRHGSSNFNQGRYCSYVAPVGEQKPKPQPKQSLTAAPDKIITDGPPPVKLCKW